ncbi:MAG: Gamma-glutamyltranspeptidase @ Glutathione hydrolase [uncultured Pyrinomonadaceae bacterium]|uniref:Glutathione hydrolase proenzyme n=1 Tax=uncultured Pyrinomonadaceae bacterium TaxID=2283094 RepID=A0A6J4PJ50_9BACT|nr:MAG: Gamma-glutamyltranspeptidase @ Glutathione hydrolase [uncultured Pyrinomonadaceae bacterium]
MLSKSIVKICICLLIMSFQLSFVSLETNVFAARREAVRGKRAMVASQHELASRIGADVMRRGGNAVDASVAVALALAVVYPEAGNLGGGGFMLIRFKDGRTTAIDYREMAPAAATRDIFVNEKGEVIKGEGSSTVGYRAAGVPGTPAGLEMAFNKYGSKKIAWTELVEPARILAQDGYVLSYRLANLFKAYKDTLEKYADSKRIFLNNGNFYEEGDVLKQPELAKTLERIKKSGAQGFYTGETARLIAEDMRANNGLITLEDLKNYQAKERTPLRGTYRGHEIISMPPPSSGGIVLLQALNVLENYDIRSMGHNSSKKYHLLAETLRRSFADRAEFMADPDFAIVPAAELITKSYATKRGATIDLTKATKSADIRAGEIAAKESMDTTHFTVVDQNGIVVSNTYTINDLYGSRVTAKGTGVLLNDEMDDFAARPGKPNMFGLIQGERNAVQPRKRPLSSMTPTIVLRKDGTPWFAVGARGGPRIITAVLQTVINMIDHDMNISQAINAPRIHHQWFPDEILAEPYGMSPDTRLALENLGHSFTDKPGFIASATGIEIEEKTGVRLGAIDARSDGAAIGY